MAYTKSKRPYKREYELQKARGEHKARMERQKARRAIDKADTGKVTTKSPRRVGKDVSHNTSLAKGGTNADGYKLEDPSKNRARNYKKKKKKSKNVT